mgnify:CR=1 FL=1
MYELLILSALMVHDRTGYKLCKILEGNLEPRRQISNGVMYPMLHKLENAGFITLETKQINGRDQKLAKITAAGLTRFETLMHTSIALDAKRESNFRFKFRAMGHETVGFQREVLNAYRVAINADVTVYHDVIAHLQSRLDRPENAIDIGWSLRTFQLALSVAQTRLSWADSQLAELAGLAEDAHFTTVPEIKENHEA